jgi:hypothetical protein
VWHIEQLLAHRIAQRWVNGAPPRYDAPVTVTDMTCFPILWQRQTGRDYSKVGNWRSDHAQTSGLNASTTGG